MDDAERRHLTDIAQNLASDAPRLAYADWLLARGRAYGEFVRGSIACAKLSEAKQAAASKALDALLKAHGKDGLGAAYPFVTRKATLFERGFPTSALATAAKFFKAGEEAALRLPGASLTLSDVNEKGVRGLLAMPRIFAGGELHLTAMGDGALADVSASPALACFRLVRLHASNTFGQPGLEAFARSPHGGALRLLMADKALDFTPLFASLAHSAPATNEIY